MDVRSRDQALIRSQEFFSFFLLFCNVSFVNRLLCVYAAARVCVCPATSMCVCMCRSALTTLSVLINIVGYVCLSVCLSVMLLGERYASVFCWTFVALLLHEMKYC